FVKLTSYWRAIRRLVRLFLKVLFKYPLALENTRSRLLITVGFGHFHLSSGDILLHSTYWGLFFQYLLMPAAHS
ncbi:hypothetical protein, partial [Paenibacillus sp. UNC496MF]|uniref:hypothetical protein n=1 Tax=Paenibacillus sp. UNC496MF TaxID=1502753 RepID=UPI001C42EEE5